MKNTAQFEPAMFNKKIYTMAYLLRPVVDWTTN